MNRNEFDDIISLTVSSCCALYVLCFLSKRLKGWFAKGMAVIGRDSFYIMGLHFLTFKLGSCSLNAVSNLYLNPADLMAPAHNVLLYIYFVLIGVLMPLAMLWIWRRLKNFIILNKIK